MVGELTLFSVSVVGILASAGAMTGRLDPETRTVLATASMVTWSVWAFGMRNVTRNSGNGLVGETNLGVSYLGFTFALIMLLFVVQMALATLTSDNNLTDNELQR
jgi:hypothetical protein